jgi:hypothetical protein
MEERSRPDTRIKLFIYTLKYKSLRVWLATSEVRSDQVGKPMIKTHPHDIRLKFGCSVSDCSISSAVA